jgi:REP element-mobilizing transposase RayT
MRKQRLLLQDARYEVRTAVNNREPLFRRWWAIAVFCRVFDKARGRFACEIRGFALMEARLSFYLRPADGLQLPAIMQWLKQTFSVRFNLRRGRSGHVWGDRYWSRVLEGEPPEEAGEVDWEAVDMAAETGEISSETCPLDGVSPLTAENPMEPGFSSQTPASARLITGTRSKTARKHQYKHPP